MPTTLIMGLGRRAYIRNGRYEQVIADGAPLGHSTI